MGLYAKENVNDIVERYLSIKGDSTSLGLILLEPIDSEVRNPCINIITTLLTKHENYKFIGLNAEEDLTNLFCNNIVYINSKSLADTTIKALTRIQYDGVYIGEFKSDKDWEIFNIAKEAKKKFIIHLAYEKSVEISESPKKYIKESYPQLGDLTKFTVIDVNRKDILTK